MRSRRDTRTRRELLRDAALAFSALAAAGCREPAREEPRREPAPDGGALDAALERLAATGPEFEGGLSNHGPMACEALHALGRDEAIAPWLKRYAPRLEPWPKSAARITPDGWRDALGHRERVADWRAFLEEELRESSWRDVLARWLPELAPGLSGAAAHALIRVSHAARALGERESAPRRAELVAGLAYWAVVFTRLPEEPGPCAGLDLEAALARVEILPEERRRGNLISDRLGRVREQPSFLHAADLVDLSGDPARLVSGLTRAVAQVYCANAGSGGRLARLHGVTGTSAVRLLLPHAGEAGCRRLLRYGWQLDAALYATHASRTAQAPAIERYATREELVEAAVESGDEHAIKLVEVALREDAIASDPAYLDAAAHWTRSR